MQVSPCPEIYRDYKEVEKNVCVCVGGAKMLSYHLSSKSEDKIWAQIKYNEISVYNITGVTYVPFIAPCSLQPGYVWFGFFLYFSASLFFFFFSCSQKHEWAHKSVSLSSASKYSQIIIFTNILISMKLKFHLIFQ